MLTARTLTQQKIEGLGAGADDYVTKPFDYEELVARIEALHRRNKKHKGTVIEHNNIVINKESLEVMQDGVLVQLSKLEFELLLFLVENHGAVMKKETILEQVW